MNTEYGLDQIMMTNMDSPRLVVTPGEGYASDTSTPLRFAPDEWYPGGNGCHV